MLFRRVPRYCFSTFPITATKLFINNEFVDSVSGKKFVTENPATQEPICEISQAGPEDAEKAVKSARQAFDKGPWRTMASYQRGRLMNRLADLLEKNREEFAYLESLDNGKPVSIANAADVELSIQCLRYYAGWTDKI